MSKPECFKSNGRGNNTHFPSSRWSMAKLERILNRVDRRINMTHVFLKRACVSLKQFEPVLEKTNNFGSDQSRHKPGCTVIEDG